MCAGSTFRWIHLTYDIIFPIKLWDCSYQLQVCRLNDLWGSSVNSGKSFQFSKWNIHGNLNDGETFTKLIIIHPPINKTVWARFWLTNLNINFSFAKKSVYLCLRVAEFAFEAAHGEESVRMILAISIKFASLMFETKVERERETWADNITLTLESCCSSGNFTVPSDRRKKNWMNSQVSAIKIWF